MVKNEEYFVPPGGGVEFGEHSSVAVRREVKEELEVEIEDLRLLGVREAVFTVDGKPGHDVVFVYAARCVDPAIYEKEEVPGVESDGVPFPLRWLDLEEFAPGGRPLYPEGLYQMLRANA